MHFCLCHPSLSVQHKYSSLLNLWLGRRDDTTKCWSLPFLEPLQSPCKSFEIFWNPNLFCCHMSPSSCKSFKIFWNLNILVAAGHIVCFECQPSLSRCPICNVRFRKILTRFASSSYHRCRCPTSRFSNSILLVHNSIILSTLSFFRDFFAEKLLELLERKCRFEVFGCEFISKVCLYAIVVDTSWSFYIVRSAQSWSNMKRFAKISRHNR